MATQPEIATEHEENNSDNQNAQNSNRDNRGCKALYVDTMYVIPWWKLCLLCFIILIGAVTFYISAYTEGLTACDTPADAEYCYVCDDDSSACEDGNILTGGCADQGCWCRDYYGYYFCTTTEYWLLCIGSLY